MTTDARSVIGDEVMEQIARVIREKLRDGGLMPAYTDDAKTGQQPIMHHLLVTSALPAALAALSAAGYVVVPREPTNEMRIAGLVALVEVFKPDAEKLRTDPKLKDTPPWIPLTVLGERHSNPVWSAMLAAHLETERKG